MEKVSNVLPNTVSIVTEATGIGETPEGGDVITDATSISSESL